MAIDLSKSNYKVIINDIEEVVNQLKNMYPDVFLYKYDIIIIGVAHKVFKKMGIKKIKNLLKHEGFIYDYKTIFNKETII